MAKSKELKTKQNNASVTDFINSIEDEVKREDSKVIVKMMEKATKSKPKMWGESIIGFGSQPYTRADGSEHDWFKIGFSPRKQYIALYILTYWEEAPEQDKLLSKLGKYKNGKSCLYVKRLGDVDEGVLEGLIELGAKRN